MLVLALVALAGCAGRSAEPLARARVEAMRHNRQGIAAQAEGRYDYALSEFDQALRLQRSIENTDGTIVALVNAARTLRLKGDLPGARSSIERAAELLREPSDLAAEVLFEHAKILLASGEAAGAREYALKSVAAERGEHKGGRLNLAAAVSLRLGEPERAAELALEALKANRESGAVAEEANSLRLLGDLDLSRKQETSAAGRYAEALALDKRIGSSRKIATDLRGLGTVAVSRGAFAEAIGFYRRAAEVSRNGGDVAAAADDLDRLAKLYRALGSAPLAQKVEQERMELLKTAGTTGAAAQTGVGTGPSPGGAAGYR